jgi:ThiF family
MMLQKPVILKSEKAIPRDAKRVHTLSVSLAELFKVQNPHLAKQAFKKIPEWKVFLAAMEGRGQWVYWPTERMAVHMLDEESYFILRTARNRVLISQEEQRAYRNAVVAIAGLSVGSSILSALVLSGGPKVIKIADFDTLEPTNLNRLRAGVAEVGSKKIELAAQSVWRVDPFARLKLYPKGVTEGNLKDFVIGNPAADVVIDEMDNLMMKVALRHTARLARVPVIMATDYGDSVLIDVERFDEEPKRPLFHGLAGELNVQKLRGLDGRGWLELVEKIIGGPYMPPRHRAVLGEVGKTLDSVSRLGTDGMLAGSSVSLAVRKIASHVPLVSGRYLLNLETVFKKPIL